MYQALARKYRPRSFTDFIGQEPVVRALSNALNNQRLHHAYLLTGTRGVGKTTLGRILAKCLNCVKGVSATPCETCESCQDINAGASIDLIEIDAASNTKVEDTRDLLSNVQYLPSRDRYKVYLIDEVHMLSGHSFNALLKTLEEPPEHVKFILATTDPQKLPITVLSRCLQFHLKNINIELITQRLEYVCQQENINADKQALALLAKAATGSLRDALSLLDQAIAYGNNKIILTDVQAMLGSVETTQLVELVNALAEHNGLKIMRQVKSLLESGLDAEAILASLLTLLQQLAVAQLIPEALDETNKTTLLAFAGKFSKAELQLLYQIALIGRRDLPWAASPRSGLEMVLLRMLSFMPDNHPIDLPKAIEIKKDLNNWASIISQLSLSGITAVLVQHCALKKIEHDTLYLQIDPSHAAMANDKQKLRLQELLTEHFAKPMRVNFEVCVTQASPAAEHKRIVEQEQNTARATLENDPHMQKIMQQFSGKIDPESIRKT